MGEALLKELLGTIEQFKYNKRYKKPIIPGGDIDPSTGPEDDRTITMRTLGVTFETIYKNIASYPSTTDISNEKFLKKTMFLENDKSIYITTDTKIDGLIITTISGDTTLKTGVTRTITYDDNKIDTVYGVTLEGE